ncbi:MAG: hypothetical protein ACK2UK_11235 [Candidatus Promineifilaceae bacterium]
MNQSSWNRWFLLSGIFFVILYLVPGILVGGQVGFMPDGQAILAFMSSNAQTVYLAGYLGTLSAFFLLWFAGSLRGVLKGAAPAGDPLADIAFGGGVAAAVLMAAAHAGFGVLSERAASAAGVGPDAAVATIDTWGSLSGVALPIAFAAMCGATGLALVRTKILPGWFGWVSVLLALALLTPVSWAVLTLILIWLVVISLWLFFRMGREPAAD